MKTLSVFVVASASLLFSAEASAAVMCQMRRGEGCNGPVVYQIQLCAEITFYQRKCRSLCDKTRPICQVSDYDRWVSAYDDKGRNGFHGPLAETNSPDDYDQTGQLAATSGKSYTVCMREKTISASIIGNIVTAHWSDPVPVSESVTCPAVKVASVDTCTAGTTFNGDPSNPRCITRDSYCSGGGASGNFASTMSAGFQMVAVQNQHYMSVPEQDGNLKQLAATAGTLLPGLVEPVNAAVGADIKAASFASSNSTRQGAKAGGTGGATSIVGASSGGASGSASGNILEKGDDSAFASKTFAIEGSGYTTGSGAGPNSGNGTSWFGSGGAASATAGGSAGDVGFDRGMAADGRLLVDDPENYFLMSDVGISLFKRVTAQCRKKERSLVLATPGAK